MCSKVPDVRTSSGPRSGPQGTNQGYPGLSQFIKLYLGISKICSAPSPLPVCSSSCHCICIKKIKKLECEVHTNTSNMQKCAPPQGPTLLIVLRFLAAASGRGFDSDGCDALPAAAILHLLWPRLWRLVFKFSQHWTKIRPICSPRRSCACTDTLRTTGC